MKEVEKQLVTQKWSHLWYELKGTADQNLLEDYVAKTHLELLLISSSDKQQQKISLS
jgi:hypothetical protein